MVINMNVGGTEKALLNMINEIPRERFDITILMLEKYGGFLDSIPNDIKLEYIKGYEHIKAMLNGSPFKKSLKHFKTGKAVKGFKIAFIHLLTKIMRERSLFYKYILKDTSVLANKYDIAIAYAGPMDLISYFIAYKVIAKKKVQWIHFDVTKIEFSQQFASKTYKKFNRIFVVSEEGKQKLVNNLPKLVDKINVFPNIISSDLIMEQAENGIGFRDQFDGIRILTVGRLSKEKGQDFIIPILAKLKEKKLNIRWYCVGEGNARAEYEQLIKMYGIEKEFILLGSTPNPYPFMKECDIYVQPSRHEGYCITLGEAKCFSKPIVSTDFTGANEQLADYETGVIVNFDEQQMMFAIKKIVNNIQLKMRS